jgi:hypothetical protein
MIYNQVKVLKFSFDLDRENQLNDIKYWFNEMTKLDKPLKCPECYVKIPDLPKDDNYLWYLAND